MSSVVGIIIMFAFFGIYGYLAERNEVRGRGRRRRRAILSRGNHPPSA